MDLQYSFQENREILTIHLVPGIYLDESKLPNLTGIEAIAPLTIMQEPGGQTLHYQVAGYQPLSQWLEGHYLSTKDFLAIELALTEAGIQAEKAGVSSQLAEVQPLIFFSGTRICYIYLPICGYWGQGLRKVLLDVLFSASFTADIQSQWIQEIMGYLQNEPGFSLTGFRQLLLQFVPFLPPEERSQIEEIFAQNAEEACQRAEEEARQRAEEEARRRAEEEARQRAEEEARQRAEEEARQRAEEEACQRAEEEARQRAEEEARRQTVPFLYFPRTGQQFPLLHPVTRIGKNESIVDFCISDNNTVSRHHADIVKQEDGYVFIDQGSLNKSYVNHQEAPPGVRVPLHPGDCIVLSNETLYFQE